MPNILIVDDANFIRTMLRRGLEKAGFQVTEAASGFEAVDMIRQGASRFDLLICDISMPGISGIETLKKIREIPSAIPVVMLTAFSDKENVLQCAKIGISGFLVKPFDIKRVRAKICEILKLDLADVLKNLAD